MNLRTENRLKPTNASDKTTFDAVQQQVAAMGVRLFEVGLYKADAGATEPSMIPRVWDCEAILKSVPWLRHQNLNGRNIYIRPKGEHDLSLVDDLTRDAIQSMKETGFNPALIVETSAGNYQASLRHPEQLSKEVSTAAAQALAEKFGGDRGAADWRHFGRLTVDAALKKKTVERSLTRAARKDASCFECVTEPRA